MFPYAIGAPRGGVFQSLTSSAVALRCPPAMRISSDVTLRGLASRADCDACVRLQRETWGQDFADVVSPTILMISQRVGGVAAGAFDDSGRLLGFVFGISGVRDGRPAHWSDMLAVRSDARRRGLGRRLKLYQRQRLLANGIEVAFWSFDPLVAPNANINLNVLGAMPVEYIPDMYGDTGSTLHRGLATDRLVVEWRLTDTRVERILAGQPDPPPAAARAAPVLDPDRAAAGNAFPADPWVRIAVAADIDALKATDPDRARLWRKTQRRAFAWYLSRAYRVAGFQQAAPPDESHYLLTNVPDRAR